jgi:hypothetical protein
MKLVEDFFAMEKVGFFVFFACNRKRDNVGISVSRAMMYSKFLEDHSYRFSSCELESVGIFGKKTRYLSRQAVKTDFYSQSNLKNF